MNIGTAMDQYEQVLQGLAGIPQKEDYDDIAAYLAEAALQHFETLLEQPEHGPSPLEQVAAAAQYLKAIEALRHSRELQLAANHFPEVDVERIRNEIQLAGIMGRPGLLCREYHLVERVLRKRLELELFYLETMALRFRGCTLEAQGRLDERLLELQLQVERYRPDETFELHAIDMRAADEAADIKLLFSDLVNLYFGKLQELGTASPISPATENRYLAQLELIGRLLRNAPISELTRNDIGCLLRRLDNLPRQHRKISNCSALVAFTDVADHGHPLLGTATRAAYQARVRQVFQFAFDEKLIPAPLVD